MRIKTIVILSLSAVLAIGCGKKKEDKNESKLKPTGVKSEYTLAQQPTLIEGFTLNGMRINDTTNNLQVILFPLQPTKTDIKISTKPANQVITKIMKNVVAKTKNEPRNGKDKNFLYIQVVSFSQDKDTLKCSFLVKEKLVSSKDTLSYSDSISYLKE
ncbi:MAG: hypothetical protein LBO06_06185 [Bacteroidales bacterium]|jgi:hypothetical protein|nr:hypothetical protein [Bacteroidales bacterium]